VRGTCNQDQPLPYFPVRGAFRADPAPQARVAAAPLPAVCPWSTRPFHVLGGLADRDADRQKKRFVTRNDSCPLVIVGMTLCMAAGNPGSGAHCSGGFGRRSEGRSSRSSQPPENRRKKVRQGVASRGPRTKKQAWDNIPDPHRKTSKKTGLDPRRVPRTGGGAANFLACTALLCSGGKGTPNTYQNRDKVSRCPPVGRQRAGARPILQKVH